MKNLILFFFLLTTINYAQVQGCVWTSASDTTGETDFYECRSAGSLWYLTISLVDSSDTITVYTGTNLPDSTYNDEIYTRTSLVDIDSNKVVDVITGDEARHTYMTLDEKRRNLKIEAKAISDTTTYYLERY